MAENTMTVSTPNEVQISNPVQPTVPNISTDPADFQKEIQAIAKEQGVAIVNGNVVIPEAPPEATTQQPAPATQQPAPEPVPAKFQDATGSLDAAKLEKSTQNAEEALRRYNAIEAELRQKQNEVRDLRAQPSPAARQPEPQFEQTQYPANPLTPDQINRALEQSKNPGQVLLELQQLTFNAAKEQARQEVLADLNSLRDRVEASQRAAELQRIADRDPWVFSDEGIKTLGAIRQTKPWLNRAPEPWLEAYRDHVASRAMQGPIPQVSPTPTPPTVKAPATPVSGAGRSVSQAPNLSSLTQDQGALNRFLDQMTPEQQSAFWRSVLPGAK